LRGSRSGFCETTTPSIERAARSPRGAVIASFKRPNGHERAWSSPNRDGAIASEPKAPDGHLTACLEDA
jgi:hypothetical protein